MGAEEAVYHKIIDVVLVVVIFISLLGAGYLIFNENYHIHLKNSEDVALFRSASLASPNKLVNNTFVIPEKLSFLIEKQGTCKIGFAFEGKALYKECIQSQLAKTTEYLKQPIVIKGIEFPGEYKINVNE